MVLSFCMFQSAVALFYVTGLLPLISRRRQKKIRRPIVNLVGVYTGGTVGFMFSVFIVENIPEVENGSCAVM